MFSPCRCQRHRASRLLMPGSRRCRPRDALLKAAGLLSLLYRQADDGFGVIITSHVAFASSRAFTLSPPIIVVAGDYGHAAHRHFIFARYGAKPTAIDDKVAEASSSTPIFYGARCRRRWRSLIMFATLSRLERFDSAIKLLPQQDYAETPPRGQNDSRCDCRRKSILLSPRASGRGFAASAANAPRPSSLAMGRRSWPAATLAVASKLFRGQKPR